MSNKLFTGRIDPEVELVVVIMAGGSGTRFWPLSRRSRPKQFLNFIDGKKSLIQLTADRLEALPFKTSIMVASGESHTTLVREHLPNSVILAEPCARNTAACLGYAAKQIEQKVGSKVMLCLPADHLIANVDEFYKIIQSAFDLVKSGKHLVTLGLKPTRPETGYGYIKCSGSESESSAALKVEKFVEKPDLKTAESYMKSGDYFWNSGMFLWRSDTLLDSLAEHFPSLMDGIDQMFPGDIDESEIEENIRKIFPTLESESIDTGLMEKASNVVMFPAENLGWSDVGAWDAWSENASPEILDKSGNVSYGDIKFIDSSGCSVYSEKKFVATIGMEDLIVVDTKDALLICPANRAQDVKKVIQELEKEGQEKLL